MRFALGFAAALALLGCQPSAERYPPPPGCEGPDCDSVGPGSHTTGPDGGAGGQGTGGGATVDQSGTVHRIFSPDFSDTTGTPYTGVATIHAGAKSGPYGGSTGTTFTLQGLPSGATWFEVEDTTPGGGSGVISTFSFAKVPVAGNFALPVLDLATLQNIGDTLPTVSVTGVSLSAAQVVLVVRQGTGFYKGLSVTGGTAGGKIAYDNGNGVYSDSSTETGAAGTVIVFNAGLAGSVDITVTDAALQKSWTIPIEAAPGVATLAYVDLS